MHGNQELTDDLCNLGVSNYEIHHLEELSQTSEVTPQVNQIFYNPLVTNRQFDLVSYCNNHQERKMSY